MIKRITILALSLSLAAPVRAQWVGGGVQQIIPGSGISVTPSNGQGRVTITNTGGGGGGGYPTFTSPDNSLTVTGSGTSAITSKVNASNISTGTVPAARLPVFNGSQAGIVPNTSGGSTTTFLRGDGTFATPAGGGGGSTAISSPNGSMALTGSGTGTQTFDVVGSGSAANNSVFGKNGSGTFGFLTPSSGTVVTGAATQIAGYLTNSDTVSPLGRIYFDGTNFTVGNGSNAGNIILNDGAAHTTTLQAASANTTWQFPASNGTSGQVLTSQGGGAAPIWSTVSSGGSGASAAIVPSLLTPFNQNAAIPSTQYMVPSGLVYNQNSTTIAAQDFNGIIQDPSGNVYVIDAAYSGSGATNYLVRITPAGVVTRFAMPTGDENATNCVLGPDNDSIYIACDQKNLVTKFKISTQTFSTISTGTTSDYIIYDGVGNIWTANGTSSNNITKIVASTGVSTSYTANASVWGLCTGPNNLVFFCTLTQVGSVTTSGGFNYFTAYATGTPSFQDILFNQNNQTFYVANRDTTGTGSPNLGIVMYSTSGSVAGSGQIHNGTTSQVLTAYRLHVGYEGTVWASVDGGAISDFQPTFTYGYFYQFSFVNGVHNFVFGRDGTLYTNYVGKLYYTPFNHTYGVNSCSAPINTVSGTSGSYTYSEPEVGGSKKEIIITFSNYVNSATSTLTYPVGFAVAPGVMANSTGLSISPGTSSLVIPVAGSAVNGTIGLIGR